MRLPHDRVIQRIKMGWRCENGVIMALFGLKGLTCVRKSKNNGDLCAK
jgi:hypothetical protein